MQGPGTGYQGKTFYLLISAYLIPHIPEPQAPVLYPQAGVTQEGSEVLEDGLIAAKVEKLFFTFLLSHLGHETSFPLPKVSTSNLSEHFLHFYS